MKVKIGHIFTFFVLFAGLSGCHVGKFCASPEVEMPDSWHSPVSDCMGWGNIDDVVWWERLQDPILNELMELASVQNLDLNIAATRVHLARLESKGKKSNLLPHIDGSVNYGHVNYSKNALVNGLLSSTLPIDTHHAKRNFNFFEIGFDADWEIDFFGRTAKEICAAKANAEAAEEGLCALWVTLSAEIARNYVELRGLQQKLNIINRNIEIQENVIQLTQELLSRGTVNEADYSDTQAQLSEIKAQKPLIEFNIARTIHRIAILLGYPPADLFACLQPIGQLPEIPLEKPTGMPSDLLRRRPDIRKAERELAASVHKVNAAIASLFPRFSLRGFLGDVSTHTGSIFSAANTTWFAGPQLLVPIFNSHLILQDVQYNKVLTQEAIYKYQKTVLEALEESENAIAAYHSEEEHRLFILDAYHKKQEAFGFAQELYQKGIIDHLKVNSVESKALLAEEACLQSHVDLLLHYISLYKALGGCW